MARKAYKKKLRSCRMCKPYKMCGDHRWKNKPMAALRRDEEEIREAKRFDAS